MRVSIRDREVLGLLSPLDLATYLRMHMWCEKGTIGTSGSIWCLEENREFFEIVQPRDERSRDYVLRISDALSTLEIVEQRSQLEILRDIGTISSDLIRIKPTTSRLSNSGIPIQDGVALIEQARDMMLAAACATVTHRPVFHTKKPTVATDYLRKVHLGQTEQGSFVVTIESPVPPVLKAQQSQLPTMEEDPFARKVTKKLAESLRAVREAAGRSAATGDLEPFTQAVRFGVSANLCDALSGLQENIGSRSLQIQISWAPVREMREELPSAVTISDDVVILMREASRRFKELGPPEEVEIEGFVNTLHRPEGAERGRITMATVTDGVLHKVTMELDKPEYDKAIEAHKQERSISCTGVLTKEGRGFVLSDPRDFRVEEDD